MPGARVQVPVPCPWGCSEELLSLLVAEGSVGRLLQRRKTLPPSMLLQRKPSSRQQDVAKEPSAR